MNRPEVIIIGAGMGGLCAGALLADSGNFRVLVLEKLPFVGGRCSSLKHKGYTLTTGAVAIEAGGALERTFEELGIPFPVRQPEPQFKYRIKGQSVEPPRTGAFGFLLSAAAGDPDEAERVLKGFREKSNLPPPDLSVAAWLSRFTRDKGILGIFRALCGGIHSLSPGEASAAEMLRLIRARSFRRFGFPPGGNSQLAEALGGVIRRRGGQLITGARVTDVFVEGSRVRGVRWIKGGSAAEASCPTVISNIGAQHTIALAGRRWFTEKEAESVGRIKASYTLTIEVFSDHPLVDFPGLLMLPEARRAAFTVCPSLVCPEWAPEGKHLTVLLGTPAVSDEPFDGKREFDLLLDDAHDFLPGFQMESASYIMRSYRKDWPGFRSRPGHGLTPETSVHGLFNVGDSVNPPALYGVGGCAASARLVAEKIKQARNTR